MAAESLSGAGADAAPRTAASDADRSRVALVTGAAAPIGRAICAALAAAGWHVAGADRRGSGAALALDATDGGELRAAVAELERVHGPVELLVTTTGDAAAGDQPLAFDAIDRKTWNGALADQLRMTVHSARAVLPGMVESGVGQIVAVTSAAALDGGRQEAHRASADGAVIGLVKALAREYGPHGIKVNTLAPGAIAPEQVAASVAFLAREPHYLAGQVLCPSAGRIL